MSAFMGYFGGKAGNSVNSTTYRIICGAILHVYIKASATVRSQESRRLWKFRKGLEIRRAYY